MLENKPIEEQIRHFLLFTGWISIVVGIVMIIVTVYWLVRPYNPLIFNDGKFRVLTKTVKQGDILQFTSDYCKYMNLTATLSRTFVNNLIFTSPEVATNRELGCHVITIAMTIPEELPAGEYHIQNAYTYQVNPIRKMVITQTSETFTVVERK